MTTLAYHLVVLLSIIVLIGLRVAHSASDRRGKRKHSIAFGSCNDAKRQSLWGRMREIQPDSLIMLGDNVYADTKVGAGPGGMDLVFGSKFIDATKRDFEENYRLLKEDSDFIELVEMVGGYSAEGRLLATYDDHDYGINNGDRSFANKNDSQTAFWNFLEVAEDSPLRSQDGVYNSRTITVPIGGRDFVYKVIMLDTRSNKQEQHFPSLSKQENAALVETGDFLGEAQWQWLEQEMADDSVDMILLGSGIQVIPTDKILEEAWHEFPNARKRLLALIQLTREHYTPNVFVLSGDVHTGEVLQGKWHCEEQEEDRGAGGEKEEAAAMRHFYEFTSSGISHTFTRTTRKKPWLLSEAEREATSGVNFNPGDGDGIEISRGYIYETLYNMYTATGVSHYREHRYGHHYRGLHYGVLDIEYDGQEGDVGVGYFNGFTMTFRILDQHNKAQMTTTHRLLSPRAMELSKTVRSNGRGDYRDLEAACDCVPFHGPFTHFRLQLSRYSLVIVPFVAVMCPLVMLLTFVALALGGLVDYLFGKEKAKAYKGKLAKKASDVSSNVSDLDDAAPAVGANGVSRRKTSRIRSKRSPSPRRAKK